MAARRVAAFRLITSTDTAARAGGAAPAREDATAGDPAARSAAGGGPRLSRAPAGGLP
ncbi:MAG TPA: hypothetical protein VF546_15770 [Pyrinomonadaceae bacterium]